MDNFLLFSQGAASDYKHLIHRGFSISGTRGQKKGAKWHTPLFSRQKNYFGSYKMEIDNV